MSVNLLNLQWRAPEFLLACPTGTLSTPQLALEYFSLSPFFDKASSNAQLRMQMMFSRGGMDGVDEEAELARFTGIEFVIAHAQPPDLFILHKRRRTSTTETTVVGAYHILNGNVYQAPSLFEVLNQRLLTSVHALETSFAALTKVKPTWTPERQYTWDVKSPPVTTIGAAAAQQVDDANDDPATAPQNDSATGDRMDVAAPAIASGDPTASAVTSHITAADLVVVKADGDSKPRPDESERPADAFNPLLFRALQAVAHRTEQEAIRDYEREQQQEREQEREREREREKKEAPTSAAAAT